MNIAENIQQKAAEIAMQKQAEQVEAQPVAKKVEEVKTETPKEEVVTPTPAPEKKVIKTVFGDREIGVSDEQEVETSEQFFERVSKLAGREVKTYKEAISVMNDPNKVSKEELEQARLETDEYKLFFQTMPDDLKIINAAYYQKKDYKEEIKNIVKGSVYTKPSSDMKKEELIVLHNPEYTKEDLEDLEEREINALYKASKVLHDTEYNKIKEKTKAIETMQLDAAKKFTKSIDTAITNLKKEMPNLEADKLADVENTLRQGFQLMEDGQYKPNAAIDIAMAKFGKNFIESVFEQTVKENQRKIEQAKSNAVEEVLKEKTNDNLKMKSASQPPKNAVEEIKKESFPYFK